MAATQGKQLASPERTFGTALIVVGLGVLVWQIVPATRHAFDLGPSSAFTVPVCWVSAGWQLRNLHTDEAFIDPRFRNPRSRFRAAIFFVVLGLAALVLSAILVS